MAKTKVIWTTNAKNNLSEIGDYIAQDSPSRAIDFTQQIFDSTIHLESFPMSGSICPEDPTCRHVILGGYRIIYEILEKEITVLTIISPGLDSVRVITSIKKR